MTAVNNNKPVNPASTQPATSGSEVSPKGKKDDASALASPEQKKKLVESMGSFFEKFKGMKKDGI